MSALVCCAAPGGARRQRSSRAHCLAWSAIPDRKRNPPPAFAHVVRRLIESARALPPAPAVLLLDEPAAGLDDADTVKLGSLLQRLARAGLAVVLVEHDMALVMSITDEIVVLDAGRRIAAGAPAVVRADPAVKAAYLGATISAQPVAARQAGPTLLD